MIELKFWAIGQGIEPWKRNIPTSYGNQYQYDSSFTITFDQNKVNQHEVNLMIQEQQLLLRQYHPNSKIVHNTQRQF